MKRQVLVFEIGEVAEQLRQLILSGAKDKAIMYMNGNPIPAGSSPTKMELRFDLSQIHLSIDNDTFEDLEPAPKTQAMLVNAPNPPPDIEVVPEG